MNEVNKEIVNDQMVNLLLIIASFTAHFVQDKQSALFTEPQRSEGELVYRTPDYLRWEYTSPQPLVWEIDGDKGNVNKQITGLLMLIKQCVKGDFGAAEKSFTVQQNGHSVVLEIDVQGAFAVRRDWAGARPCERIASRTHADALCAQAHGAYGTSAIFALKIRSMTLKIRML